MRALWGDEVEHVYLPYDLPGAVRRFLDHFRPRAALIMETEMWPNLLFGCRDRGVPSYILNARLSERSLRGYRVLAPLVGRALRTVRTVAAQSHADARALRASSARAPEQTLETGNLKYDVSVPDGAGGIRRANAARSAGGRPVWIAASTHEDEEAAVIAIASPPARAVSRTCCCCGRRAIPSASAPSPNTRARPAGRCRRAPRARWPQAGDAVFVIDTLGELMSFYACADVAFVGGSLQAIGGHNLLEPAAVGTAIVTGPHLHNFAEIARRAGSRPVRCGSARMPTAWHASLAALLGDREAAHAHGRRAGAALVEDRARCAGADAGDAGAGAARRGSLSHAARPRRHEAKSAGREAAALRPPSGTQLDCAYCAGGVAAASASTVSRRLMSCTSSMSSVPAACSSSRRFCRKL